MSETYISPSLPSMIRGLYDADLREKSVRNMLDLAADLVQELIDLRADQGKPLPPNPLPESGGHRPQRLNAKLRASLIDFAKDRIQAAWGDVGETDAEMLAKNVVSAQEWAWLSAQVPIVLADQGKPQVTDEDERINAWERVAEHPACRPCYDEERPLIDAVMDRLTDLCEMEATVNELRSTVVTDEMVERGLWAWITSAAEGVTRENVNPRVLDLNRPRMVLALEAALGGGE